MLLLRHLGLTFRDRDLSGVPAHERYSAYAENTSRCPFLAFGIAGLAPDERPPSKRTTGAVMSNIRQSDVKNHLSPRFRAKIHLCQPESQPDATGFPYEEPASADPVENDSVENPLNFSSTGERTPIATATPKGVQG